MAGAPPPVARRARALSSVEVVIPWRDGCPHRQAALLYVADRWAQLGHPVRLGSHEHGAWCKADAVQAGIDRTSADVIAVADGDVWSDAIPHAIGAVVDGAPWAVPHTLVHRLTPKATDEVLAGTEPHDGMPLDVLDKPYAGRLGGGIVILRRDVWGDCPIDRRFRGWGHEDESWAKALGCLYGPPVQFDSTLWHLWHPPQERITWGLGSPENEALYKRYHHAASNPDRGVMRALIAEGASTRQR